MQKSVLIAVAAVSLLGACQKAAQETASNETVSNDAPAAPATPVAPAAPVSSEQAQAIFHERHEGMEDMSDAAKVIGRELKSDNPDLEAIRASAKKITDFAPHAASLFPPGTGPDVGKTGAKPEIWQNPQDFTAKAADFQKAAQAFGAAAQGNDLAAIKATWADLGNTCKACHDKYRSKMKH